MNSFKTYRDLFHFSKRERAGLLGLIVVLTILVAYRISKSYMDTLPIEIKSLAIHVHEDSSIKSHADVLLVSKGTQQPSAIDPNAADFNQWISLGLGKKLTYKILNYRKAGGKFTYKEDILKIYGMDSVTYAKISPYLLLANKPVGMNEVPEPSFESHNNQVTYNKLVELNDADSAALEHLPGIGPYLAKKILNFRKRSGGFIYTEQLLEFNLITQETFDKMKDQLLVDPSKIVKIKLNTATVEQLGAHPLIGWPLAKKIVNYRQQHGPYDHFNDLNKIYGLEHNAYERILPYLILN